MSSSFDVKTVTLYPGDPGADNKQLFVLKAPENAVGGGITIVGAVAVNGAATGAGTTFTYQLLKYSNAGTPAVNGTISDILGGTAAPWAAGVPKTFTLSTVFIDAGEWVVLDYQEITNGNPTLSSVVVEYVMGK